MERGRYKYGLAFFVTIIAILGMTLKTYHSYGTRNQAARGFVSSRQMNLPPGFSTRLNSRRAISVSGMFRIPKATVTASNVLSGKEMFLASEKLNETFW